MGGLSGSWSPEAAAESAPRSRGGSPPREPQSRSTIDPTGPPMRSSALPADVSDAAQTHELVGAVVSEFGGLDLLVSNAGVEHFGALETITQADFNRLFQPAWPDNCSPPRQQSPR